MVSWDCTAGNRTMWKFKNHPQMFYTDIEQELEYIPTEFLDCTKSNFNDKSISSIWFDPPHIVGGSKNVGIFSIPSKKVFDEKYPKYKQKHPRYYGTDKFKDKESLLKFLHQSSLEFNRVLNDDGFVMVKWTNVVFDVKEVVSQFIDFVEMMRIPIKSKHAGSKGSFWIVFMKKGV
jgi:hypothetical protein